MMSCYNFKVPRNKGRRVIKRLSTRYELSEKLTSQILRFMDDEAETGELSCEDEKYCVNVKIRETDFDIYLFSSQITVDID